MSASLRPSKAFIESDRVEGTAVHGPDGRSMGSVKRLIIEKLSGRVAYVVIALSVDDDIPHTVPWSKLRYDPAIRAYHTDVTEQQLRDAPAFARQANHDWSKIEGSDELDTYYNIPPHLRAI
jgi:hypothetical protein